jgi:hypothetical protein
MCSPARACPRAGLLRLRNSTYLITQHTVRDLILEAYEKNEEAAASF